MTMRALILSLTFLTATPFASFGQTFGILGGIDQTNITTDEASNTFGTETGYTIGALLNFPLPANFAVGAEGRYSQKIITQQNLEVAQGSEFNPDARLELGTIEIPIILTYRIPTGKRVTPRLYGGPVIGVAVNESVDLNGKEVSDVVDEAAILTQEAFAERETGYMFGVGATLDLLSGYSPVFLMLDARYTGGLTTIQDDFEGNGLSRQINIGSVSAVLGIGF